ncbi:MAG: hypothetical protein HC898_07605, partial [Phycisphaerales bacterium]|nr:hypothetical protein [Phycisphaerales bacterium]
MPSNPGSYQLIPTTGGLVIELPARQLGKLRFVAIFPLIFGLFFQRFLPSSGCSEPVVFLQGKGPNGWFQWLFML